MHAFHPTRRLVIHRAAASLLAACLVCWPRPVCSAAEAVAIPDRGADVAAEMVETFTKRNGAIFTDWPTPKALVVITGELDGYIEPCGCTGKENQKGCLSRRRKIGRAHV